MSTQSMNKQSAMGCNIRVNLNKGSPVHACVSLVSCLQPVKRRCAQVNEEKEYGSSGVKSSKSKYLRTVHANKELAIYLERKCVESLLVDSVSSYAKELSLVNGNNYSTVDPEIDLDVNKESLPQEVNIPDPFWCHNRLETIPNWENIYRDETIKTLELVVQKPTFSWSNITINNTSPSTTTMDMDLTPPSSTPSGSIASSYSEDNFPQDFFQQKVKEIIYVDDNLRHGSPAGPSGSMATSPRASSPKPACPNLKLTYPSPTCPRPSSPNLTGPKQKRLRYESSSKLCKDLEMRIAQMEPSLQQIKNLYNRQRFKRQKNKKIYKNNFRESNLRPRGTLRQFIPFVSTMSLSSQKRGKKSVETCQNKRVQKNLCQLLESASKKKLKAELKKKKEAFKLRNKYENALDSINRRLFRQNRFWRMLPG